MTAGYRSILRAKVALPEAAAKQGFLAYDRWPPHRSRCRVVSSSTDPAEQCELAFQPLPS